MKKPTASQSAFLNLRAVVGLLLCFAGVTLAFFAFRTASAQPRTPSEQSGNSQPLVQAQFRGVLQVVKFDISPPLRDMKPLAAKECTLRENEESGPIPLGPVGPVVPDPVVQRLVGSVGIQIPNPIVSFDGNSNLCGCSPPDPNGEVGPNHVVTMANLHFQIFNKTGTSLFGPAANNTLWSGFGGDCQTDNAGDPIVLYDQLADRWLLTQFTSSGPTFFECVALSQTNDPLGSYYRWAIATGPGGNNFPDYPKAGMWPDAYYFSTREFQGGPGGPFQGVGAYALDRAQALVGNPNPTIVGFLAPPNPAYVVGDGLLPSDLDGMTPPPVGSPNYFVGSEDNNGPYGAPADALTVWKFHYDPGTPVNSTFTLTNTIPTAPFNSILALCAGGRACIPQPGTANRIDHLGYRQRPLHRLAYRNFGTHESLVTNQSVSAGTGPNGEVSGIRWWELRSPNAAPVIFQQGTYAPGLTDGIHRWMGSIAMDSVGNMALGYSASNGASPAVFPSLFYTGRLVGDPPGQMTQGEGSIINGAGSQTGSNRWGDYTALSVDPTDDLTFWYVNEYVPTTSSLGWRLRIGSFKVSQGFSVTTTVPAVGSVVFTQPTDFVVNLTDPVDPTTVQATDFTVNAIAANSFVLGGGNTQITFHYNSTPVTTQGVQTMNIAAGAFNKASGGDPVLAFAGTFRYDATLLQVTTTVPAVGGVFTPPAPGSYQYDVNWNEAVDPASVSTADLTLGGSSGGNVTGVTVINANMTTRFTLNLPFGGTVTANIAAGAIADSFGNPGAVFSGNYTVGGCPPQDHYTIAQIGGSIVPGTTDIGNHADDLVTNVVLPFTYSLYGTNYTSVNVSSNGNAQFTTTDVNWINSCPLPWTTHNATIFPYWDDQLTNGAGEGIFTSVSGTAPNRIFNIEWRTHYFNGTGTANYELRLYEGLGRFDVIYGAVGQGNTSATAGVQKTDTAFDTYFCTGTGGAPTGGQSYILQTCAAPLAATRAVSRQNHGAPGDFDVNLPLSGSPGIECRQGAGGAYQMRVSFANPIVSVNGHPVPVPSDATLTGTGSVSSITIASNVVVVNLTGVTDVQQILMTLLNVSDGTASGNIPVPMKVLIGDSAGIGNSSVGAADVGFVKSVSGQVTGAGNFRADIAINGSINAGDVGLVKSKSGNSLP